MKKAILLIIALAGAVLVSLMCGAMAYSPEEVVGGLLNLDGYSVTRTVMLYVRLPRTLAAVIAGAGLSCAGTLLQCAVGNPLAGPNIIGLNAGAGLGTVLLIAFAPALYALLPLAAFIGAMFSLLLVLLLSRAAGGGRHTIILAGVALTAFFQAGIALVSSFNTDVYAVYSAFALGSLNSVRMQDLYVPGAVVLIGMVLAYLMGFRLQALAFGDDRAGALGLKPQRLRMCALTLAALEAAAVVSYAGLLGFVGLIVPHISEALFGPSLRRKLVTAPVIGAVIVILADVCGRTLFLPSELSVGVITSILGAPAFVILLLVKRGSRA